jgi:hypothetical protein
MKKTSFIFVCVLLFVFCVSSVSYSVNDMDILSIYGNELSKNIDKMRENAKNLTTITYKDYDNNKTVHRIGYRLMTHFKSNFTTLIWLRDVLLMSEYIKKEYQLLYVNYLINKITECQSTIDIDIDVIDRNYGNINKVSLLHIVEKHKDITRSSLDTLDKTIKLLKKMDKKQKKQTKK